LIGYEEFDENKQKYSSDPIRLTEWSHEQPEDQKSQKKIFSSFCIKHAEKWSKSLGDDIFCIVYHPYISAIEPLSRVLAQPAFSHLIL